MTEIQLKEAKRLRQLINDENTRHTRTMLQLADQLNAILSRCDHAFANGDDARSSEGPNDDHYCPICLQKWEEIVGR